MFKVGAVIHTNHLPHLHRNKLLDLTPQIDSLLIIHALLQVFFLAFFNIFFPLMIIYTFILQLNNIHQTQLSFIFVVVEVLL